MWQLETMFWLHIISTHTNTHSQAHPHIQVGVRHADTLQGYASKGHCLEPVETKVASGRKAARKAVKAKDTTKLPPTLKPRLALPPPHGPGCACRVRYLNPSCPKLSADPPPTRHWKHDFSVFKFEF